MSEDLIRDFFNLPGGKGQATARGLFAAMAMQAFISSPHYAPKDLQGKAPLYQDYAYTAVKMADALIAELAKERA